MGFKKAILVLLLLIILTMGAASAADNSTDNLMSAENATEDFVSIENNDEEIIKTGEGSFEDLTNDISAVAENGTLTFTRDYAFGATSERIVISKSMTIDGQDHTINGNQQPILKVTADNVILKNIRFTHAAGIDMDSGPAINWGGANGQLYNCSFEDCIDSTDSIGAIAWGGANAHMANCRFNDCTGFDGCGAASFGGNNATIVNCSFVNCDGYTSAGAVEINGKDSVMSNCSFITCRADQKGGAIKWNGKSGRLTGRTFVKCSLDSTGGAVYWDGSDGEISNCTFANCTVTGYGGAIYWNGDQGNVSNCSFTYCSAAENGGAIYWNGWKGNASDNRFENCSAAYGGAIYWNDDFGTLTRSTFKNTKATRGGAAYWTRENGKITNSHFEDCSLSGFTIIYVTGQLSVIGSDFINDGNQTLYELIEGTSSIINCTLNGIPAQTADLSITIISNITGPQKIGDTIELTVKVYNNGPDDASGTYALFMIPASLQLTDYTNYTGSFDTMTGAWDISSLIANSDATLTLTCRILTVENITATATVDSYADDPNISNNYAIANIEVSKSNATLIFNPINTTYVGEDVHIVINTPADATGNLSVIIGGENYTKNILGGMIIFSISGIYGGNHTVTAYYSGDENYMPCINTTFFTVNRCPVNMTAIAEDIIYGQNATVEVILPSDATGIIEVNVSDMHYMENFTDGVVIAKFQGLDIGTYIANIAYTGDLKYLPANTTITFKVISNEKTFSDLQDLIDAASDVLELDDDYINDGSVSADGIEIAKTITINGNGHTLDAKGLSRIFNINAANVVLNNITLINGHHDTQGGAIYWNAANGNLYNSSFLNCSSNKGGAIQWTGTKGSVIECNFENNSADTGGAIYWYYADDGIIANSIFYNNNACAIDLASSKNCRVTNCNFVKNSAYQRGGSIHWYGSNNGSVSYCNFTESYDIYGGAVFWHYSNDGSISNCNFVKNTASNGGAIRTYASHILVSNSKFIENRATLTGGAIEADCSVYNCTFINNTADSGGAIEEGGSQCFISECTFIGNNANSGGGAIRVSNDCSISNCTFEENTANYGGAIWAGNRNVITNCTFTDCSSNKKGGAVYWNGGDNIVTNCTFINCSSTDEGGAIALYGENSKVDNSIFINSKGSAAKAIYVNGDNSTISNSNFEDEKVKSIYDLINQGNIINCTLNGNKTIIAKINIINSINEYKNGNFTFQVTDLYTDEPIAGAALSLYTTGNIRAGFSTTTDANGIATFKTKNIYEFDQSSSSLSMKILEVGNHTVELNTKGNVESASVYTNLTIIKANIDLAINIENINATVTANSKKNEEAVPGIVLRITSNNQDSYLMTDENGTGRFILNLPCGTHTITVSTNDTKNINYTEVNITIDVPYKTFQDLSLLIENTTEGSILELNEDYQYANGTNEGIQISKAITIDGKGHTLDAKGSSRIFKINAENVTLKNIIFKNGHGNNGGAIQWMNTKGVAANCTFINCSAENGGSVYWNGENGMINTSTFDHSTATSNGGAIYWNANNGEIANSIFTNSYAQNGGAVYVPENRNVEIKSSIFDNNMAEEESGAVYGGTVDDDCTFKNNTYTPLNTTTIISINETAAYTGNDISITTIVLSQKGGFANTGTVEIYINSKLMATIPANTQYIHTTGEIGTYQVLAKFIDDSSYKNSSSTAEFTVIPVDIPEEIETSTAGIFTLEFPDDAEGTLTVFIDGTKYKVYDIIGGILKIDLSDKKGKYNITFEYSGDKNYPAFKKDANITVETNPSITASNAKVIYSAGTTYKITVYKNKGITANSVNVVIKQNNKKFKTIKTNSKGIASFKVTQTPGTYKLKITSLGKTVTKTLTVKHIVTLKTATVKKSAKKLTLQATLAKVNGKYLKKKTITFKINGKKVATAKTNSKGVAKITIKNPSVVKKLKVGKKITYQATYLKDTVKKTAKVKK